MSKCGKAALNAETTAKRLGIIELCTLFSNATQCECVSVCVCMCLRTQNSFSHPGFMCQQLTDELYHIK